MKRLLVLMALVMLTVSSVGCARARSWWNCRRASNACDPCDPCAAGQADGPVIIDGGTIVPGPLPGPLPG